MTQHAAPPPGWYDGRYWTGREWATASPASPESPWAWVGGGAGLALVGGLAAALALEQGAGAILLVCYATIGAGWIGMMVGVIAAGVRLGSRHADYERARRAT